MIIVLLVSILIVALLSVYLMNKLYFKQSEDLKENGLDDDTMQNSPGLQNPQNQVDDVRNRVNEIQDEYNKKINDSMLNK